MTGKNNGDEIVHSVFLESTAGHRIGSQKISKQQTGSCQHKSAYISEILSQALHRPTLFKLLLIVRKSYLKEGICQPHRTMGV